MNASYLRILDAEIERTKTKMEESLSEENELKQRLDEVFQWEHSIDKEMELNSVSYSLGRTQERVQRYEMFLHSLELLKSLYIQDFVLGKKLEEIKTTTIEVAQ